MLCSCLHHNSNIFSAKHPNPVLDTASNVSLQHFDYILSYTQDSLSFNFNFVCCLSGGRGISTELSLCYGAVCHDKARDTWANIVGRQCRLSFWRPTVGPDSRPERKRKRILVITSYFVKYKNEKPHNFSKETTLATIINTMRYIYSYRYMCFVGYHALTCLLAKNPRTRKIDHVGPVTG